MATQILPMDRHPRSLDWFSTNRNSIYIFISTNLRPAIDDNCRHILIKAPVKSGKREHVECNTRVFPNASVFYVTSLDRKDVVRQKAELEQYNVYTHLINSVGAAERCILAVKTELAHERMVIICFDECDYGSGSEQKMASLYREFVDDNRVVKLYYSASAHETEASSLRDRDDFTALTYVPPPEYCGAEYFHHSTNTFRVAARTSLARRWWSIRWEPCLSRTTRTCACTYSLTSLR